LLERRADFFEQFFVDVLHDSSRDDWAHGDALLEHSGKILRLGKSEKRADHFRLECAHLIDMERIFFTDGFKRRRHFRSVNIILYLGRQ